MPIRIEYTVNQKEDSYRREVRVNTDKAKRNDDQKEQGVLYVIPEEQRRLKARLSLVCEHLLSLNAIYGEIESDLKTRLLHLESGTKGFKSFTPAEYLEEMLRRFMNARTKGGVKQEFEQRSKG